jgi:hypothetical protein
MQRRRKVGDIEQDMLEEVHGVAAGERSPSAQSGRSSSSSKFAATGT